MKQYCFILLRKATITSMPLANEQEVAAITAMALDFCLEESKRKTKVK